MSLPIPFVKLIQKGFPFRFFLARLSNLPLLGKFIDHLFFRGDSIIYLPQNKVVSLNRKIDADENFENIVLPSRVVEHFVEQANYHWIMNFCICRDSAGCKDFPIELGCLFLGKAVTGINPKLGRSVSKGEALKHLEKCREHGLVHLIGRNKLDTAWLNVGPGTQLLTICNCCPCCCLWKMLPMLSSNISDKVTRMPGVNVKVTERCTGCGLCTEDICFVNAIHLIDKQAAINQDCRGCGRCVSACPHQAITLTIDSSIDFFQESINKISTLVDVK